MTNSKFNLDSISKFANYCKENKDIIQQLTLILDLEDIGYYLKGGKTSSKKRKSNSNKGEYTNIFPYGQTLRDIYRFENPKFKGIKNGYAKPYDSRTLGAGVDFVSGFPEIAKRARAGKVTKAEADRLAIERLRHNDELIRKEYAAIYGKNAADTLSYGPRMVVAQARYLRGSLGKHLPGILRAMASGNESHIKNRVIDATPKGNYHRINTIINFPLYDPKKFANGGSIHIKKSNKGKFTEYCGGKVTSECIRRGKNSKDPKIRKRATFAANARTWKHLFGGLLSKRKIYDRVPAREWRPTLKGSEDVIRGRNKYQAGLDVAKAYLFGNNNTARKYVEDAKKVINSNKTSEENKADALAYLAHEDAKDVYLNMPQRTGLIEESPHVPSKNKDPNSKYYRFKHMNGEYWDKSKVLNDLLEFRAWDNISSKQYVDPTLNTFTASLSTDKNKGDYLSIYDIWDYNTAIEGGGKDNISNIIGGKPFDIYDRIYLDDYYGIDSSAPKGDFYGGYLPEVTIKQNKNNVL